MRPNTKPVQIYRRGKNPSFEFISAREHRTMIRSVRENARNSQELEGYSCSTDVWKKLEKAYANIELAI